MNIQFLEQLHKALGEELLARIKSGTATSGDLSVALNMLKHNNYALEIKPEDPLAKLVESLPDFDPGIPVYQ